MSITRRQHHSPAGHNSCRLVVYVDNTIYITAGN